MIRWGIIGCCDVTEVKSGPGFRLARQEGPGRTVAYTMGSYAADRPHGRRYANGDGKTSKDS